VGHPASAGNEILGNGIGTYAYGDFLVDRNIWLETFASPVGLETFVDHLRNLPQSQFAEGNEIATAKKIP
jgi:hypothetical protein